MKIKDIDPDVFHIDPKAIIAPGITYEEAVNEAVDKLAEEIDRQVLESLLKK